MTGSLKSSDGRRNGIPSDSPEDRLLVAHTLRAEGFDASEDGTGRGVPLVADCLKERDSKGSDSETKNGHLVPMAFSCKDSGQDSGPLSPTLRSMEFDGSHANGGGQVAVAFQASDFKTGQFEQHEQARPLTTSADRSRAAPITASVMGVRRLTPTECERLQGFSDGWTAGFADGPRYRMLGNAVARPCAEWIGRRLVETARRTSQG